MRYIYSRIYDNHTEIREVTKADIDTEGLKLGCTETDGYDAYLDEFESDEDFNYFWNECRAEGARIVTF